MQGCVWVILMHKASLRVGTFTGPCCIQRYRYSRALWLLMENKPFYKQPVFKVPHLMIYATISCVKYVGKVDLFIFRCCSGEIFKPFCFLLETELIINVWVGVFVDLQRLISSTLPQLPKHFKAHQDRMLPLVLTVHQWAVKIYQETQLNFSSSACKAAQPVKDTHKYFFLSYLFCFFSCDTVSCKK